MTAPFRGLVHRSWLWLEAASVGLAMAAFAAMFIVASTVDNEVPITQTAYAEHVLPVAPAPTSEAQDEQLPEPMGGERADRSNDPPPPIQEGSPNQEASEPEVIVSHTLPGSAPTPDPEMDEVNQYLWAVYERTTAKQDGSGDFTWKDVAAAARLGMTLGDYVIGGMDRDFREILYRAGQAMDAAGFRWTILSAFRDDYRQVLAAGYKARIGDSLHGGSFTTGGYGHGCAVDIKDADGKSRPLLTWLDGSSLALGLERPLPGIDPAHVQPRGPWHEVAAMLRSERLAKGTPSEDVTTAAEPVDVSTTPPSEADWMCIGLHHHHYDQAQVNPTPPPDHQGFKLAAAHAAAKPTADDKPHPKSNNHAAARPSSGELKTAARGGSHAADSEKLPQHAKGAARSPSRHALHAIPHNAGTT
jgi:hypothetical protein